jgi:hypothetical protein
MSVTIEAILSSLVHLFAYDGKAREVAILADAEGDLYHDGDRFMTGVTLTLRVNLDLYVQLANIKADCEKAIEDKASKLFGADEYLKGVSIEPRPSEDPQWREKAKAWLAGSGVNNQGRVRSDNIASRTCDGLLFRSEPEIHLYRALKSRGVSFAPLAVFIRGGPTYRRIEPDFLILKDGMVMVVEVDGDTVHLETPAEAHDRTSMLMHEGAHIERIKSSQCDTPEMASLAADRLVSLFEKFRKAGR